VNTLRLVSTHSSRAALLTLFLLPLLAQPVSAQQLRTETDADWCRERDRDRDDDRDRYCEVRTTTIDAGSSFEVDASPNGGISVEAWDRDEIEIRAKVQTHARRPGEARSIAGDIDVRVEPDGVSTDGPGRLGRREGWSVSYRLRVPRRMDLKLRSVNGGIALAGVHGAIDLRTTNGGLSIRDAGGDVRGRSTNGGITARLEGRRWDGRGLDLETTNGGVHIEVPEGYSARLEAATTHGGYSIDFPITVQGRVDSRRLAVDLGDGGPTIRAVTTNGGVSVSRS